MERVESTREAKQRRTMELVDGLHGRSSRSKVVRGDLCIKSMRIAGTVKMIRAFVGEIVAGEAAVTYGGQWLMASHEIPG